MHRTMIALGMLALASPLLAQAKPASDNDPTHKVAGGNAPAGWAIRLDEKDKGRFSVTDTKFQSMGDGYHVTSGPAALYYASKDATKNEAFTLSATFVQTKAPTHPEAYGLFITGRDLDSEKQSYVYFLVRGDGQYFVAHRGGAERHVIAPWTAHEAIARQDAAGKATNALSVKVAADSVHFLVNGKPVFAAPRAHMPDASGQTGIRVNHNLDVHVSGLKVEAGGK